MNLDEIPGGSLCVLDTIILLYAEQGSSAQAQRLIHRCAEGQLVGVLPQTVWQELTHKLMLAEAMARGEVAGFNLARKLAERPAVVKQLRLYREKIRALADLGLQFEPCTRTDLFEAGLGFQEKYGLLTADSVLLAVALRLKAEVLVTADAAFASVSELKVARPSDIRS